jgi:hypothetical protein
MGMRFGWVRYVERDGAWGAGPVALKLKSSRLAAAGYFSVLTLAIAVLAWPLGAVAGAGFAGVAVQSTGASLGVLSALKLGALAAITFAFLGWLAVCCFRSTFGAAAVRIDEGVLRLTRRRLFGARVDAYRLAEFEGLAVLPVTTLGGRMAQLYLVHPNRAQSVLLATDLIIQRDEVFKIADALGVPVVGEAASSRPVTHSPASTPTALAA